MAIDPITAGLELFGKVIDRVLPNKEQADAAKAEAIRMQMAGELQLILGQQSINQVEAGSSSVFVAGWRPFIGWVCGLGCAWNWIGLPVAKFILALQDSTIVLQMASMTEMMPLLFGLLGIGGYRTYEKVKGVA